MLAFLPIFALPWFSKLHWAYAIAILLVGVADAMINGALESWASEVQEEAQGTLKALPFARRDQAQRIGMIGGALAIPFLATQFAGVKSVAWLLYFVLAVGLFFTALFTPSAKQEKPHDPNGWKWWLAPGITSLIADPSLRSIYLGIFCFGIADGVISTCFWPSLRAWGITSPMILGCIMTGMSLFRVGGVQIWKSSGRIESDRTPGLSVLLSSLFFVGFALIGNAWIAVPLWMIRVAVISAYFSTIQALLLRDPRVARQRATVMSIAGVLASVGEIVSTSVIGGLSVSSSSLWIASLVGAGVTAVSGVLLLRKRLI